MLFVTLRYLLERVVGSITEVWFDNRYSFSVDDLVEKQIV